MKKMIMSIALMLIAFLSHAAEAKSFEKENGVEALSKLTIAENLMSTESIANVECSVTMKGTIDLGPIEAEVSCTTTAQTCQKATMMAVSCLSAAVKTVRTIVM